MTSFSPRSWLKSWRPAARMSRRPNSGRHYLLLEPLEDRRLLSTYTVTNGNNAGAGSLRQALTDANGRAGQDFIHFRIGSGPRDIILSARLPVISDQVFIDGTTQPGYSGTPLVTIGGGGAGWDVEGLDLRANRCVVRGLTLRSFNGHGIAITSNENVIEGNYLGTDPFQTFGAGNRDAGVGIAGAGNSITGNIISGNGWSGVDIGGAGARGNVVQGNRIGTNASGTVAVPNRIDGVRIRNGAVLNTIGGADSRQRNIISGNAQAGVAILHSGTTNNVVYGNYIGTNVAGTAALGNTNYGVSVREGASFNVIGGESIGQRNVISGNGYGVALSGNGTNSNIVHGNYIGTNAAGTAVVRNAYHGVAISTGARNNIIGGLARNVISGSGGNGVELSGNLTTGNVVRGNYIGTNAAGTAALGHNNAGVYLYLGANSNTIGGDAVFYRNVISGNRTDGVVLRDAGTNSNVVQGNYIGLSAVGTPLGNGQTGVAILAGTQNNTIGGAVAGAGNTIAFNVGDGVDIAGGFSNAIRGNAIFANGRLGIDLGPDGVTPNDPCDADAGANNLQNYPVLVAASTHSGRTVVQGTLNSTASRTFAVEFFAGSTRDPSGFGEGEQLVGRTTATTGARCTANFTMSLTLVIPVGWFLSATATDAAGNTSEFSRSLVVSTVTHFTVAPSANPVTAGTPFTLLVSARDAAGELAPGYTGTVQFTSTDGNATLPPNTTFTPADNGQRTVTVTLRTAGIHGITVRDTVNGTLAGSANNLRVIADVATQLSISGQPASAVAGTPFSLTVTARDQFNNVATGFTGTVAFYTPDPTGGSLPPDYTFTTADAGVHTFSDVALFTAGAQTIYVFDTPDFLLTYGEATVNVTPGPATFFLAEAPAQVVAGVPFTFTVWAMDNYYNVATGYLGTVYFYSEADPDAAFAPTQYTFTAADAGAHTFADGATFFSAGPDRDLTVYDDAGLFGQTFVIVDPSPGPDGPAASTGRAAAWALSQAEAYRSAPPVSIPSRERPTAEGTTLRVDDVVSQDRRPDGAAVDAIFGGASPRRRAAALPVEDGGRFWQRVFTSNE